MSKQDKDDWIRETQMFQRIAKIQESTYEELSKIYDQDNGLVKNANGKVDVVVKGKIVGSQG